MSTIDDHKIIWFKYHIIFPNCNNMLSFEIHIWLSIYIHMSSCLCRFWEPSMSCKSVWLVIHCWELASINQSCCLPLKGGEEMEHPLCRQWEIALLTLPSAKILWNPFQNILFNLIFFQGQCVEWLAWNLELDLINRTWATVKCCVKVWLMLGETLCEVVNFYQTLNSHRSALISRIWMWNMSK